MPDFVISRAGPDGIVCQATDAGPLRRYRWNGSSWDTFENGANFRQIEAAGWERYSTAAYRTASLSTPKTTSTRSNPMATCIGGPTTRSPKRWLTAQRFLTYGQYLGASWETYDRIFSAGGDILYGVDAAYNMYWYRFNEDTHSWYSTRKLLGGIWQDRATIAVADTCERVGASVPARVTPVTDPHTPVPLLTTSDQAVHYSYVDAEKPWRARHGSRPQRTDAVQLHRDPRVHRSHRRHQHRRIRRRPGSDRRQRHPTARHGRHLDAERAELDRHHVIRRLHDHTDDHGPACRQHPRCLRTRQRLRAVGTP